MEQKAWWKGAVIYQVYPRSMMDTNGDGIGDLNGIIEKLDYIQNLGVDAIWISPFFRSPMKDFGYDISDYRDIDPLFGNLEDFDRLIDVAHEKNIKVIIDQVLSHTSDQHQWFLESRENRDNKKADWYVWADPKEDGTPPNNWLSIFGGGAWQWEPRRQQYYLHNFLCSQPDLNFHNPEVQQAALDNIEFWLKRGVDGFRLDAINFCFHDALLRNNPAKPKEERQGRGFCEDNPYAFQYHYFNNTQPENISFIEKIRALLNKYPDTTTLGEISSEDSLATMADYTDGDSRLHMGYSFELLTDDFSANYIRNTVETLESKMKRGWPCWAISNHDVTRVASRWKKEINEAHPLFANKSKMFTALLGSLRGTLCSYQGEELGLPEADISFDELQDPYGITFWPNFKGRDGCRTPLPWTNGCECAGFSSVKSWLPIPDNHKNLAVSIQESDKKSVLSSFKRFMKWRKNQPALLQGSIEFFNTEEPVLALKRECVEQGLVILFNLSATELTIDWPINESGTPLNSHGLTSGELENNRLTLPAFGVYYCQLF